MYEPGHSISNKIAWAPSNYSDQATQMDKPTQMDILFAICRVLIYMADLFVFAGTNWENSVPESGIKIFTS